MNFKILHIATSDSGGAGLAALRLHHSLMDMGVDSKMLVASKTSDERNVFVVQENGQYRFQFSKYSVIRLFQVLLRKLGYFLSPIEKYHIALDKIPVKRRAFYTFPITNYDLTQHPLVQEADIIHLHWIANFVDFSTFFAQIDKPIIWTMHDLNPFYGGFHHRRFHDELYSYYKPTEDDFCRIKEQALQSYANLSLVAISKEMKREMMNHKLYKNRKIFSVYNSVDPNVFTMIDKQVARKVLKINAGQIFLFVNRILNDREKGLTLAVQALERLNISDAVLVCVGDGTCPESQTLKIVRFHSVNDETLLSLFYSCADYLLFPSYQEAFAQTPLESMCCGTPVVMTPVSAFDMIKERNGVICSDFTAESFAQGIQIAMLTSYNPAQIRQDVIVRFNPQKIAQEYVAAYQEILLSKPYKKYLQSE